jgi:transcriptional regulator with XRE-family HTH domain
MPTYPNLNNTPGQPPRFEKPLDDILEDIKRDLLACGCGQSVEVKRKRKPKSQKQLGNIFGNMIAKIEHEANEVRQDGVDGLIKYLKDLDIPKGVEATPDFIKKVLYTVAPTFNGIGKEVTLSKMDTKQASDFFKRAANIMSGYVPIPDPSTELRSK